jgi:hypothetical protein
LNIIKLFSFNASYQRICLEGSLYMADKSRYRVNGFQWLDAFLLERQLSEEERIVRDAAASFARGRLQARVSQAYLNETIDSAVLSGCSALRFRQNTVAPGRPMSHTGWLRGRLSESIRATVR